jgi:hypothetical protein
MTIRKIVEKKVEVGEGDDKREVEFVVKMPNNDILKRADRHKSKVWNDAMQDGVLTKKELTVVMEKRGIWNEAKGEEEKAITDEIVRLEKRLYHGDGKKKPKLSEGRNIAVDIRRQRIKLRNLLADKISMEENTADSLADNARFDFLVAHCTYQKGGQQPYYQSFQDYDSRSTDEVAFTAASVLGEMIYNMDSSFEKRLPENMFLLKYDLVNEDLSLIDPNSPEELIDTEGRRIDKDGYYLDDEGHRIDRDGNALTEDGNYELVDYDNDLVIKKPSRKKTVKKEEIEPEPATES